MSTDPTSATGGDFFRGGSPASRSTQTSGDVYASFFDYGLYRDSGSGWEQIFASAGGGAVGTSSTRGRSSRSLRTDEPRIYVGDTGTGTTADFYTVANARGVAAATLVTGGTNGGWTKLSNSTNGTPGFGSFNYCVGQCSYDMPVYSRRGSRTSSTSAARCSTTRSSAVTRSRRTAGRSSARRTPA